MSAKLTRAQKDALERLAYLHDKQPLYWGWKAMFIGSHNAATCRRSLVPAGLVEVRKGWGSWFVYAITPAGRAALEQEGA